MSQVGIRCQYCVEVDLDALVSEEGYRHHASWEDLVASADQGCELCKLIERWQHNVGENNNSHTEEREINGEHATGHSFVAPRIKVGDAIVDKLIVVTDAEDPVTKLFTWNGIARDNESEACFQRIFHWIKQCSSVHIGVCAPFEDHFLPTRVLDVGISSVSEPYLLVNAPRSTGRWLTLSHCWGPPSTMSLKTILSNVQAHQSGIPFSKFPRSFQDAICITRRLGFRYLWIDSLCIIQDSRDDWLIESMQMGRIYRESALTIVADEARDSTQGIFAAAIRQGKDWPTYVDVNYSSKSRAIQGTLTFRSPSIDALGNIPSPLSRRAWTLQETTLSPRVLRYSHEELFWSCNAGNFSESSPDVSLSADRDHKVIISNRQVPDVPSYRKEVMHSWYGLIRDYAFRKITYPTDRFVALSGLTRLVHERSGYSFAAGLWTEDIHRGLLWVTPGDFERATPYIAPTWSWASVLAQWEDFTIPEIPLYEDHVIYGDIDATYPRAQIFDMKIDEESSVPMFGQVKSAKLVLRAAVKTFEALEGIDDSTIIEETRLNRLTYEFDVEREDLESLNGCFDDLRGNNVICLQVARIVYQGVGKVLALVLEPVPPASGTASQKCYQRIGRVQIPEEDGYALGWDIEDVTIL